MIIKSWSQSMAGFDYSRLDPSLAEVRIVTVDCGARSPGLTCTLENITLDRANPFHALSYTWGDTHDLRTITLNGQHVQIRKNLYQFLSNLYTALRSPVKVWIDSICINQNDIAERNSQVAMMGEIYAAADSVYAWLGMPTGDSHKVFGFVERSSSLRSQREPYWKILHSDPIAIEALHDLVNRPYWTRLWIVQEVVLAKRLFLFCGPKSISWEDFLFVLAGTKWQIPSSTGQKSSSEALRLIHNLRRSRESSSAMPLSALVRQYRMAECQDGRDKIYGLLAIATIESKRRVTIDYNKHLLQVLIETFHAWASDWILDQDNSLKTWHQQYSFTPTLFCQQLSLLFPDPALIELCEKPGVRATMCTKVSLKGIWQKEPLDLRPIATILPGKQDLVPNTTANTASSESSTNTVSHMVAANGFSSFIYTTVMPLPGDRFLDLGAIFLIVRHKESGPSIVGRGIQQRGSSIESFLDPHRWSAQILPDSIFRLSSSPGIDCKSQIMHKDRPSSTNCDGMNVVLNAAALVELLVAIKRQDRTWRPYSFGLRHAIVDLCTECRQNLHSTTFLTVLGYKSCQCLWTGGEQPLSKQLLQVQRHCSILDQTRAAMSTTPSP